MIRTVIAMERDGIETRAFTIQFDVPNEGFDIRTAARKAATDYCKPPAGRKVYAYNCSYFNWADFVANVPREFCEKYGFKKIDAVVSDVEVDWDEQLVDDSQVYGEGENCVV